MGLLKPLILWPALRSPNTRPLNWINSIRNLHSRGETAYWWWDFPFNWVPQCHCYAINLLTNNQSKKSAEFNKTCCFHFWSIDDNRHWGDLDYLQNTPAVYFFLCCIQFFLVCANQYQPDGIGLAVAKANFLPGQWMILQTLIQKNFLVSLFFWLPTCKLSQAQS